MKRMKFFVIAAAVMTMSACSESMLNLEEINMPNPTEEPVGFHVKDVELVDVVLTDESLLENVEHPGFIIRAEDPIRVAGTTGIKAAEALSKVAEETLTFAYNYDIKNKVVVEGLTMQFTYKGREYTIPCLDELTVSGSHRIVESSSEPAFYELSKTDYVLSFGELELAGDTQIFVVEEGYIPPVVDHVDWEHRHVSFQREATVSNNIINVFCDNVADFVQVMSDNSRQNEESVDYTVRNRFSFSASEIQATADDAVVGNTYNFVNGVVTVCGTRVSAQWMSAEVEGEVMYRDQNYASEIVACEAEAKTITFTSASEAVIRFYDHDSEDYAEVSVPVTVTPVVTVVDVARDYRHEAFRSNAVVANNTISVICDNVATQTTTMSDGTTTEATADYTVTNRFVYSLPALPASVKGQSFRFNAGTAVVEGYNVTVTFSSREVSAIMFNGTDYRNEAPVCQVNVTTIAFGESSATVTFEDDDEEISATIPVDYIEAEIISGEIVGMWITDAYQGRSLRSTDLHILARNNDGSYVVYSRGVNETSFTTSSLTASEGQYILSSGMPLAWAYRTDGTRMLSLVDYIQSSKSNTGYVINYWNFNNQKLIGLGDAEAALNGEPFAEPLKAVGVAENGTWTISYNGTTNYFVGTINK